MVRTGGTFKIGELNFDVAAELPENLAAGAAGRGRGIGVGDNRDTPEHAMAFRQRFEHRDPLGARGEPEAGALDVAAGHDQAVGGFERGAHFEM